MTKKEILDRLSIAVIGRSLTQPFLTSKGECLIVEVYFDGTVYFPHDGTECLSIVSATDVIYDLIVDWDFRIDEILRD